MRRGVCGGVRVCVSFVSTCSCWFSVARYDRCPDCTRPFESGDWRALVPAGSGDGEEGGEGGGVSGEGGSSGRGLARSLKTFVPFLSFK